MALVGERRAIAAAVLSLYTLIYVLNALLAPDPAFRPLFAAMGAMYGLAFFALVAGYFWARWFAIGLGIYGLVGGVFLCIQMGVDYIFLFYGGTHGAISLFLWGDKVATLFDGRSDWRQRFHLDESGTHRLGKAIIRIGITLPLLLAYGLAPRDAMSETLLVTAVVGLAGLGVFGLLRMRTWGVLLMVGAGVAVLCSAVTTTALVSAGSGVELDLHATGLLASLILLAAAAPFAGPVVRYLRH